MFRALIPSSNLETERHLTRHCRRRPIPRTIPYATAYTFLLASLEYLCPEADTTAPKSRSAAGSGNDPKYFA
jgi:hypothetical protein